MRDSILAGMVLVSSLVGASCAAELGEVDGQSSEASIGVDDGVSGDAGGGADDPNAVLPDASQCPLGRLCLWNASWFAGAPTYSTAGTGCINLPFAINNLASSWYNRAAVAYVMYDTAGCPTIGSKMTAATSAFAASANPNMTGFWNDRVSSICRPVTGISCP
jgi:hypothetical protein